MSCLEIYIPQPKCWRLYCECICCPGDQITDAGIAPSHVFSTYILLQYLWRIKRQLHQGNKMGKGANACANMVYSGATTAAKHDWNTVYPKKYAHGFVVLCFVVVMQSFIMHSHEVFIHIHQGCFAGTGAIVRLPQCQWSKPGGYGKISQCITTTKHSKAKTVCIFLGIYCTDWHIAAPHHINSHPGQNCRLFAKKYFHMHFR